MQIKKRIFSSGIILKDLISQSGPMKVVRKVRSVYSSTVNQGLFGSVMLLWAITTVQQLGNLLKQGMEKTLQKAQQVLRTGLIKFFGQVLVVLRKAHHQVRSMSKKVQPKGNVYKAIKNTEAVELIEQNRNND